MRTTRKAVGAAIAGLSATLIMEYASEFLWSRQSEESRERENRLREEMPTTVLVRKAGKVLGTEVPNTAAERLGMIAHYGFGAGGGVAAATLNEAGLDGLTSGLLVAGAMSLTVDEGANTVLGLTAPAWEFPATAHVRGLNRPRRLRDGARAQEATTIG